MTDIRILKTDGTAATGLTLSTSPGVDSSTIDLDVWFRKDSSGGEAADFFLVLVAEDPDAVGTYLEDGLPATDEHHFSVAVISQTNPNAVSSFAQQVTGFRPIGKNRPCVLLPIPGGCARRIRIKYRPRLAAGPATSTQKFQILIVEDENGRGVAEGLAESGLSGILTRVGDRAYSGWKVAPSLSPSGAVVTVSVAEWIASGIPRARHTTTALTLNQNDSAASALTSGQRYYAVISQPPEAGAAAVATKGLRGTSPARPAMPEDHLWIGEVAVRYQAGGTSAILTSDISSGIKSGRFTASAGTGLQGKLSPGQAILDGVFVNLVSEATFSLVASETNRIWVTPGREVSVTQDDVAPVVGALHFWNLLTDGSGVTSIVDKREGKYLEPRAKVISLLVDGGAQAPSGIYRERAVRELLTIAAAASSDTTCQLPAGSLSLGVSTRVVVQPPGTSTFDVGDAGDATRFATAVSSAAATENGGQEDGITYQASAAAIRITPDATPSTNAGRIEVTARYREFVASTSGVAREMVPYSFAIDRVVFSLRGEAQSGATGQSAVNVKIQGTSCYPQSALRPTIPAGSLVAVAGTPEVTEGTAGQFVEVEVTEVCAIPAGAVAEQGLAVAIFVSPV